MYKEAWTYLPDQKDIPKLPRQWVVNVLNTVVGRQFSDWVREQIDARNKKLRADHNLNIELDPEIAEAFRASSQVSSKYFTDGYM